MRSDITLLCKLTNMKRCVNVYFLVWRSHIHASMLAVEVHTMYTLMIYTCIYCVCTQIQFHSVMAAKIPDKTHTITVCIYYSGVRVYMDS